MPRQAKGLTAKGVETAREPRQFDGDGLVLDVSENGAKSWGFLFVSPVTGKRRQMGLGSVRTFTLAEARERARKARQMVADGLDPIEERQKQRDHAKAEAAKRITFKECAETYIKAHERSWKNDKHRAQWRSTLKTYAYPTLGSVSVAAITTPMIVKVLKPLWHDIPETARRVRNRIELVLDSATAMGARSGENPARLRGHLDKLLPKRSDDEKPQHHAALPFTEIGTFLDKLRAHDGIASRALEFLILTATRTNEVINAEWDEINFKEKLWTIPASRMKAKKEHRVPLSPRAIEILKSLPREKDSKWVFAGGKEGESLSNMAMLQLLKRMKRDDLTVHGFRSCFRDFASERTNYPREVCEMALAHKIPDKVEAAYRRGDLFDKRTRLMGEWAKFCAIKPAAMGKNVIPMQGASIPRG